MSGGAGTVRDGRAVDAGSVAARAVLVLAPPVGEASGADAALLRHAGTDGARFHLLVPATPPRGEQSRWVFSEHLGAKGAEAVGFPLARLRLERGLRHLRARGLDVDGEVGDPDPYRAVVQTLARDRLDEVLVLVPAGRGPAAWTRAALVRRLRQRLEAPVGLLAPTGPVRPTPR